MEAIVKMEVTGHYFRFTYFKKNVSLVFKVLNYLILPFMGAHKREIFGTQLHLDTKKQAIKSPGQWKAPGNYQFSF